jgi:hypothetical protein
MTDYVFYNEGCTGKRGTRWFIVPLRRLLRRILRPIFQRQVELLHDLGEEQERLRTQVAEIDEDIQDIVDFGWDYVSLVRRLTALEREVQSLKQLGNGGASRPDSLRLMPEAADPIKCETTAA